MSAIFSRSSASYQTHFSRFWLHLKASLLQP